MKYPLMLILALNVVACSTATNDDDDLDCVAPQVEFDGKCVTPPVCTPPMVARDDECVFSDNCPGEIQGGFCVEPTRRWYPCPPVDECGGARVSSVPACNADVICVPLCDRDDCPFDLICTLPEEGGAICLPPDECVCTMQYDPVCGRDGETYSNDCAALCAGVDVDYAGECGTGCACDDVYQPVCGEDGQTYSNACEAECAGIRHRPQACDVPCNCSSVYDPVCGDDGQTYGNDCEAVCAYAEVVSEGPCP